MKKGFTLIELLIVVAIIAILAAIAVPNFLEAQTRSKVSRVKADMRTIATAVESYAVDNNRPPTAVIAGTANSLGGPSIISGENTATNAVSARFIRLTTPVAYITAPPRDAFETKGGTTIDPLGNTVFQYDTFDYISAYDFVNGAAFDTTSANWRGAGISSGATWRVVSPGPDRVNFFGGGYAGQHAMPNRSFGLDYDPTNGTVSRGDIVRIGSGAGPINPNGLRNPSIDRVQNIYNESFN